MQLNVLYEDNHIIAVYKPAGLLVQPARARVQRSGGDKTGEKSLMDEVKKYLKEKYKKPGNVFLGLVHRLDRNVSGIVLFGKTSKGASRLSEQFLENTIKKTYNAVVEGEVKPTLATLVHYLKKDENRRVALISESPKEGYDKSELSYEIVLVTKHYSLATIQLKTGRFHQIRAQFSAIGHPVLGDVKYGFKIQDLRFKELALCATEIEFKTATSNEVKNIKIAYPKEWAVFLAP